MTQQARGKDLHACARSPRGQVRRRLTRNGPRQASRMVQQYALFMEEKIEMHHDVRAPAPRRPPPPSY